MRAWLAALALGLTPGAKCEISSWSWLKAMRKKGGFTLLEMVAGLAIMAIVLAFAVPSFREVIRENHLSNQINAFLGAHNLARSEAVKRGETVSMCKSTNSTSCGTGAVNWGNGWIVFVNNDNDSPPAVDAGETILQVATALEPNDTLRGSANVASYVSYFPTGEAENAGTFVFCIGNDLTNARAVFISINGRVKSAARNSSGTPLDDNGTAIATCTP